MQRRSFFKKLFGVVVGGLAAPHLAASAEPIVMIDPAAPVDFPMNGGMYPADHPVFRGIDIEGGFYKAGETFGWSAETCARMQRRWPELAGGAPRP